jgi:hypothetical protein
MQDFDYSYYVSAAYLVSAITFVTFATITIIRFTKKKSQLKKIANEK